MTEEIATSEKLLTFIIPVYKVEKYINECVDSILNQLTDACEVILVDDGSPDRSGVICDGYADRDSRVKVVHQKMVDLQLQEIRGLTALEESILHSLILMIIWTDSVSPKF